MNKTFLAALAAIPALFQFAHADALAVGAEAPRLQSTDQHGQAVDLGALYDQGLVLVYFYPRAATPGCTAQACSLRDQYEVLQERGVRVVGVSTDSVEAQSRFAMDQQLPFTLLADPGHAVIDAFGVPINAGHASRQAFLIHEGRVIWRDLSASTAEQAADVLAALDELQPADANPDAPATPASVDAARASAATIPPAESAE